MCLLWELFMCSVICLFCPVLSPPINNTQFSFFALVATLISPAQTQWLSQQQSCWRFRIGRGSLFGREHIYITKCAEGGPRAEGWRGTSYYRWTWKKISATVRTAEEHNSAWNATRGFVSVHFSYDHNTTMSRNRETLCYKNNEVMSR